MLVSTAVADEPFRGWDRPNYTQVPDNFFDQEMLDLPLAETRVLLYIIRRTLGFRRDSDDISVPQIMHGRVGRDGRVLERGTGLSRPGVQKALRALIAKGMVLAHANQSPEYGSRPTTYSLPFNRPPAPGVAPGAYAGKPPPAYDRTPRGPTQVSPLPLEDKQTGDKQLEEKSERDSDDSAALWKETLTWLQTAMNARNYRLTFEGSEAIGFDGEILVVQVKDQHALREIQARYGPLVAKVLGEQAVRFEGC